MTDNLRNQPENLNFIKEVNARLIINNIPDTTYFIQTSAIPGISLGDTRYPTPIHDIPIPGDTLIWSPLVISFLINENLSNYFELFDWMTALAGTPSRCLFKRANPNGPSKGTSLLSNATKNTLPNVSSRIGSPPYGEYTDMMLTILSNNQNPLLELKFLDAFPIDLGQIDFTTATTESGPLVGTATFNYNYFTISKVGSQPLNEVI